MENKNYISFEEFIAKLKRHKAKKWVDPLNKLKDEVKIKDENINHYFTPHSETNPNTYYTQRQSLIKQYLPTVLQILVACIKRLYDQYEHDHASINTHASSTQGDPTINCFGVHLYEGRFIRLDYMKETTDYFGHPREEVHFIEFRLYNNKNNDDLNVSTRIYLYMPEEHAPEMIVV